MKYFTVEVYRDEKKEWRWRIFNKRNKKIVGASTEGYKNRGMVFENLDLVTTISKHGLKPVGKFYFVGEISFC